MKKSHQKIAAVVVLVALGAFAFHKYRNRSMGSSVQKTTNEVMEKSYIVNGNDGNFTKFWIEGKEYYKQSGGPTVKSIPVKISEAEYKSQYAN